jgi:outer membrane lipoprotein carrier protein
MLNRRNIFAVVFSFFICMSAHAQSASDDLTALLLNITSMKADFSQTISKQKSGQSMQQSSGHMALERPGKFRWETVSPNKQLIIANGERLWIYDPDLEQVTVQAFRAGAGKTPALLLSDKNLTLGKDYNVTSVPAPMAIAGYQIFQLTPKDSNDTLEKITLSFIRKQIHEMKLQDRLGNMTVIAFHNVLADAALPDSLFTFKAPANVDVIDESKDHK